LAEKANRWWRCRLTWGDSGSFGCFCHCCCSRDGSSWAGSVAKRFASGNEGGSVAAGSVRMGEIAVASFVRAMVARCREKTVGLKPVKL